VNVVERGSQLELYDDPGVVMGELLAAWGLFDVLREE